MATAVSGSALTEDLIAELTRGPVGNNGKGKEEQPWLRIE